MSTDAQAEASRRNGVHSHGPTSEEGKARSSMNRFQHGLAGKFTVLKNEIQEEFDDLLDALRSEHQPETPTEHLLVDKMAEHYWLSRRAQTLQDHFLDHKNLALYLRYQTANDRGFSKCLSDLLKLRAERRKQRREEMEDRRKQLRQEAEDQRKQELNDARVRSVNAKAEFQELETDVKSFIQARLPGHTAIPFRLVKQVLANALEQFAAELDANPELAKTFEAA